MLDAMLEAQMSAIAAVRSAIADIGRAIEAAVPRLRNGGRLFYVGAGTSGRIGLQDGVELVPTFGWPTDRIILMLAGGPDAVFQAAEGAEDQEEAAATEILAHAPNENDVVIGVAASGSTPYTCAAIGAARKNGSLTIGLSCSPSGLLLSQSDHGILVQTGAEIISGSTRLKAGTAQKAVLNMISTTIMTQLGHAYKGQMVDMRITNAKLAHRAVRMVSTLTGCSADYARETLAQVDGNVKRAVLLQNGYNPQQAGEALTNYNGDLRKILND